MGTDAILLGLKINSYVITLSAGGLQVERSGPAVDQRRHSEPDHGGGYSTALLAAYWHDRAASSIIGA